MLAHLYESWFELQSLNLYLKILFEFTNFATRMKKNKKYNNYVKFGDQIWGILKKWICWLYPLQRGKTPPSMGCPGYNTKLNLVVRF